MAALLLAGCSAKVASPPPSPTAPAVTPTPPPPAPSPSPTPAASPAPAGFTPASVTFVSLQTGWVLGAQCPTCTVSILRTRDGGRSWANIAAPQASLAPGAAAGGVRELRFANLYDGWAFGPDLWATHDGGAHWDRPTLPGAGAGVIVSDLEASAGVAHLALLDGGVRIESSPVGRDAWQPAPTTIQIGAGPVPAVQIVLQGSAGWMIENDRTVIGGARLSNGAWVPWQPPCMSAGGPATLAAATPTSLAAVCDEGIWTGPAIAVRTYLSADGVTFGPGHLVTGAAGVEGAAHPLPSVVVVGTDQMLVGSFNGAASWTTLLQAPQGGWTDLGFTSPTQGVVVATMEHAASLLMTRDGGHTWKPVTF